MIIILNNTDLELSLVKNVMCDLYRLFEHGSITFDVPGYSKREFRLHCHNIVPAKYQGESFWFLSNIVWGKGSVPNTRSLKNAYNVCLYGNEDGRMIAVNDNLTDSSFILAEYRISDILT
jgi:hypothetical protein